jgi:ubiquitin carboxyl-terminal hydrolase 7
MDDERGDDPLFDSPMLLSSSVPFSIDASLSANDVSMENSSEGVVEQHPTPVVFPPSKHQDSVIASCEHVWMIEDWQKAFTEYRVFSEPFFVETKTGGGWWFKILLMPHGQDNSDEHVALYLALDEEKNRVIADQQSDWSLCVEFVFSMLNPDNQQQQQSQPKYIYHRFEATVTDWGFAQFMPIKGHEGGSIESFLRSSKSQNSTAIKVSLRIIDDPTGMLWVNPASAVYDSKRATGCVGLQNQGATCYMNSILQSLFLTNAFRKSVYSIPTDGKEPHDSIPLALQRLFYALTFSSDPPNTNDLTASFGWDLHESFTQHDVQEFLRVLMDDLEEKMKGTSKGNEIDRLFGGRVKKVIRCLNVPFQSSRSETVYDVQLPVAGCPTLKDSFDSYIASEMMTGDNKYMAEGHGLQDAEMFNVFDRLPPILHLILMRYRYDPYRDTTVKINDRFEFPEQVDLSPYMAQPDDEDQVYLLHSVLVHSGDGHGGHYTAFIRPDPVNKPDRWLKFDDTRVTVVSKQEAMDDNFGGRDEEPAHSTMIATADGPVTRARTALGPKPSSREAKLAYYRRVTNAYMLVYIRRSQASETLCPFTIDDIPSHIIEKVEQEHRWEEERRQERLMELRTVKLSIYTPELIASHPGYDLFCADPHPVCPLTPSHKARLSKNLPVSAVIDYLKSVDPAFANGGRLWTFTSRRNRTLRFDTCIYDSTTVDSDDANGTSSLEFFASKLMVPELRLFAEPIVDALETGNKTNMKSTISIYFKLFDCEQKALKPLGALLLDQKSSLLENEDFIRRLAGIPSTHRHLSFYEEVKAGRVDRLSHPERPFVECELQSGDIIIIDPGHNDASSVIDYYDRIDSTIQVTLIQSQSRAPLKRIDTQIDLVISTKVSLEEFLRLVEAKVGWPWDKILLTSYASDSPIKSTSTSNSQHVPMDDNGALTTQSWYSFVSGSDTVPAASLASTPVHVYYELLPITIFELGTKRKLKFRDREGVECQFWVDRDDTLSSIDFGDTLCKNCEPGSYHFYDVSGPKIVRQVPSQRLVKELANDCLFVERFEPPRDEHVATMIPGYTHNRDIPWGTPFVFKLIAGEPIAETRKRVAHKLGITNERDASKLTLTLSNYGRALKSGEPEGDCLMREMRVLGQYEQLAVEMVERKAAGLESAIKIKRSATCNSDQ